MQTQYIELDSTYRDRTLYPNPSDFVVDNTSALTNRFTAKDPVSEASPANYWNTSFREDTAATSVVITGIDTSFSTGDNYTIIIEAGSGQLRNIEDYYVGAILTLVDATPTTVRSRIEAYERINATQAEVTLSNPIPNSFPAGALAGTSVIQNPTGVTNTDTIPRVFVPASPDIDNYYINDKIMNLTTGETFDVTYFDGTTHLATLSANTSATWLNSNQNIVIRRQAPGNTGDLIALDTTPGVATSQTGRVIQLASTASSLSDNYVSSFMRMINPYPTANFSVNVAPYAEERKIIAYVAGNGTFLAVATGTNTFTLDGNGSLVDSYYVGALLTNVTTGETRKVATYVGATRSGTVEANWGAGAIGNTWLFRSATLATAFSTNPSVAGGVVKYEIELFSRDNATPINFTGSVTSNTATVCCEIELITLVLPNSVLASGRGGLPIFYPSFLVELDMKNSSGSTGRGNIYSNNPNMNKAMFIAVLSDSTQPIISPFIRVDSDSMVQTVKFNPNSAFHVRVYHLNGEPFETEEQDYYSPSPPNPLTQIQCTFSFKRMQ